MLYKHAVNDFSCDSDCATDCTNTDYFDEADDMLSCLDWCSCEADIISITTRSDYNYASLLKFSGYDKEAWSFFMKYRNYV